MQVRYNRKRLKGGKGPQDCLFALTSLFNVMLSVCKVRGASWRLWFRLCTLCYGASKLIS